MPPKPSSVIRTKGVELSELIERFTSSGDEQTAALTKLSEVIEWAAAQADNPVSEPEPATP